MQLEWEPPREWGGEMGAMQTGMGANGEGEGEKGHAVAVSPWCTATARVEWGRRSGTSSDRDVVIPNGWWLSYMATNVLKIHAKASYVEQHVWTKMDETWSFGSYRYCNLI